MPSVNDLARIASNGGGMIIDARTFSVDDLARIAANAKGKGQITIRNTKTMSVDDIARVASNGDGNVVFDFTD